MRFLHHILLIVIAILSAIGCGGYLQEKIGMTFLGGFTSAWWEDIVVAMFMVVLTAIILRWKLDERMKKVIGVLDLFVTVFYVTCRVVHPEYMIPSFTCDAIKYSDVTLVIALVLVTKSWIKQDVEEAEDDNEAKLLSDTCNDEDVLARTIEAQSLVKHLLNSRFADSALGVSVTGSWGIGKTYFLNQIKAELLANNQMVFDFNPWNCNENEIVGTFFDELESRIIDDDNLSKKIRRYARQVSRDGNSVWLALSNMINSETLSEKYDVLKKCMKKKGMQMFVLMDDCDRLDHDELKKAISLIRNVANLPYLVFIIAFDEDKVKRILGDDGGDSYLNKMFNLNHRLLPLSNDDIVNYLTPRIQSRIKNDDAYTEQRKKDNKLFDETNASVKVGEYPEYDYFRGIELNELLPTFREVKRYLNMLIDDFGLMSEVVDNINFYNKDFVLLELIKYKDINLYLALRDNTREILDVECHLGWDSPNFILKDDKRDDAIGQILKTLFGKGNQYDNPYSIRCLTYFKCYFSKLLPKSIITKAEFAHLYDEGVDYEPILAQWIKEGKKNFLSLLYGKERTMYTADLLDIMAYYTYCVCENCDKANTLSLLRRGWSGEDYLHSYELIKHVVRKNPLIWQFCFQSLGNWGSDENVNKLNDYIEKSEYKLELIAIFLLEIRVLDAADVAYSDSNFYFYKLWDGYLASIRILDAHSTDNIIQILNDCLLPDVTEKVVLPLIKSNLSHWIGRTLIRLTDGDNKYLFLDNTSLRALFETFDKAKKMLASLTETNKEDASFIDEYSHLLTYFYAHRKVMKATDLEEKKFPLLAKLEQLQYAVKPFSAAAKNIPSEFWEDKTFRKYEHAEYYFA